jgi:CRP-like cAMP-binding protein
LSEKEATVNSAADFKSCADFLGEIPAFSLYSEEVLEEFVTHAPFRMHVAAGKKLCGPTRSDGNLYVLISGSASLDAGDGVRLSLGAGDYFGRTPGHYHYQELMATVIAAENVEVLVIRPEEVLQLEIAASRHRHPSQIEWRGDLAAPAPRNPRRRQHALAST